MSDPTPRSAYAPVGTALALWTDLSPRVLDREMAVWLVTRLAKMLVGGYEVGTNEGPFVRILHRTTGAHPGDPWCASFLAFCCAILGGRYPLTPRAYCPDLAMDALRAGLLDRTPEPGDILLYWHYVPAERRSRFAHVGLIVDVRRDGTVDTIEGNTTTDGSRDGWRVCLRERRVLREHDRVIHWHHALPEAVA